MYRSRTGGNEWEALTEGLAAKRLLRQRTAQRPGGRLARSLRRVLRHHRRAGVRLGRFRRSSGRPSSGIFPPCCRSKSRHCHDPGRAPHASVAAGECQPRDRAPGGRSGHYRVRCWTRWKPSYPMLRGTIRDHVTKERRRLHPLLRLRRGLVARAAGTPLPEAVVTGAEPLRVVGAMAGG